MHTKKEMVGTPALVFDKKTRGPELMAEGSPSYESRLFTTGEDE